MLCQHRNICHILQVHFLRWIDSRSFSGTSEDGLDASKKKDLSDLIAHKLFGVDFAQ
jgi:hypothetical protein